MGQNPGSTIIVRNSDRAGKTPRRKMIILAVEAVVALILLAFIANSLWANSAPPALSASSIPQRIAGLSLQKSESGPQAVANFNRLHGKDVGTSSGWVGYYEGNGIVWTAETTNEAKAYQLVDAMTKRIRAGNDQFGNLDSFRVGDLMVFTVVGQGQRHYYYQKGNKVVWIAAPKIAERAFMDDAVKLIN